MRQLAYDFRDWLRLEGTGRTGSDEGFDVRGIEVSTAVIREGEEDDADEESPLERIWLIQCKREKAIAAKKISGYMDELKAAVQEGVYGVIFAAACDFSKATRDAFLAKARELELSEAHLWGKSEIEDMLFQPRNDHLLFAYFGISLLSRRRAMKTEVRSRLAAKRKAKRVLSEHQNVLVRDASDHRYPHLDPDKSKDRIDRGRWKVWEYEGCFADGLHFRLARHFAWIAPDGVGWDFAEQINDARPHNVEDPWQEMDQTERYAARQKLLQFWNALPETEKAHFEVTAVLPYDHIIDIDEHGDEYVEHPHIYTTEFSPKIGPFLGVFEELQTSRHFDAERPMANPDTRLSKFQSAFEDDGSLPAASGMPVADNDE